MLTCIVALLPITIGALVTTLKAGMAFADWPTSDGQNMLLYPWLSDLRNTDKFVEHGHRLAGVLIGCVSIGMVVVAFMKEKTPWVRHGAAAILFAVILQGLLGGMRVRMNEQVLAMTHSITGGMFFTLCFLYALLMRPRKKEVQTSERITASIFFLGVVLPGIILTQYVLGGFFRHLGTMLHEHIAGAILVTLAATCVLWTVLRQSAVTLKRRGWLLAFALVFQILLGLGSWVTKMGFPTLGWVASVNSPTQTVICSLHTVGGMFLLATSAGVAAELIHLARLGSVPEVSALFANNKQLAEGGLS